jgi:hypothetical protein
MRRLLSTGLYICFLALTLQTQYEVAEHAHQRWGVRWPGWEGAAYAERVTLWHPSTGVLLLDRLIHEGTEAGVYYRWLLTGSPALRLELAQHG